LNANKSDGQKNQNKDKLCPGDSTSHSNSPFKSEFSALLDSLSTKALEYLLTSQQKNLAKALWEACNVTKNPTPADYRNREPIDFYYKWVLLIEHEEQWRQHNVAKDQKIVKLSP
jgi:hypothetical protein